MKIKKLFNSVVSQPENTSGAGLEESRRGFFAKAGAALASLPVLGMGSKQAQAQPFGISSSNNASFNSPLVIARQGSFMAGGSVLQSPGVFNPTVTGGPGQTLHGDHAYAQFQIPQRPRVLPLVFWPGGGQTGKSFETTADGREGFQSIFLRRDYSVYILDQPRRARAANSTVGTTINPTPGEQDLFVAWRLGVWPNFFPNSQFPQAKQGINSPALNQFFRWAVQDTGPQDIDVITDGVAALIEQIGPCILIIHSASGILGWTTAMKSPNVKAIYAFEPGGGNPDYAFPIGEVPPALGSGPTLLTPNAVPLSDFLKLTKIPIRMQFGDGLSAQSSPYPRVQLWLNRFKMAQEMVATINKHGGNASILHLPNIGIHGNTHFSFSDANNLQIADIFSQWLSQHHLDAYDVFR